MIGQYTPGKYIRALLFNLFLQRCGKLFSPCNSFNNGAMTETSASQNIRLIIGDSMRHPMPGMSFCNPRRDCFALLLLRHLSIIIHSKFSSSSCGQFVVRASARLLYKPPECIATLTLNGLKPARRTDRFSKSTCCPILLALGNKLNSIAQHDSVAARVFGLIQRGVGGFG